LRFCSAQVLWIDTTILTSLISAFLAFIILNICFVNINQEYIPFIKLRGKNQ